jgi:hypothetical protein
MGDARLSETHPFSAKFIVLTVSLSCLTACYAASPELPKLLFDPTYKFSEKVEVPPAPLKIENPSNHDVEIVEVKITNLLIEKMFEAAEKEKGVDPPERSGDWVA